jgi:hypothetical protein
MHRDMEHDEKVGKETHIIDHPIILIGFYVYKTSSYGNKFDEIYYNWVDSG